MGPGPRLGAGLDLPWGPRGFVRDPNGRDHVANHVQAFVAGPPAHGRPWSHLFFSLQPRDRSLPDVAQYRDAWDHLMECLPEGAARALHTTALNLGAPHPKNRTRLLSLVNAMVDRYGLRWINEDLGLWTLGGKPLPYPLPPYLTESGLQAAIDNTRLCQRELSVPLLVEFPGFAKGVSLPLGDLDAYDFFRRLIEETDAPCTLDVGHLMSWRFLRGHRGEALLAELERLPLWHCFEIHLSGCLIDNDAFFDLHHGVLLPEQLEFLQRLLPLCPNVRAVTFEDPALRDDGTLEPRCAESLAALAEIVPEPSGGPRSVSVPADREAATEHPCAVRRNERPLRTARDPRHRPANLQEAMRLDDHLSRLVWNIRTRESFLVSGQLSAANDPERRHLAQIDAEELRSLARQATSALLARAQPGVGSLKECFGDAFAAWRKRHPADRDFQHLAETFCANHGQEVREGMTVERGSSLEQAFAEFAQTAGLLAPRAAALALAKAVARAWLVSQPLAFTIPSSFQRCGTGVFAVIDGDPPFLVAAIGGQLLEGPITELIAALLTGTPPEQAARDQQVDEEVALATAAELRQLGLLPLLPLRTRPTA
ncbi:MAG: DUF692 family protein [Myxococcales bacterium]|nr:DUF692 family protein [Myxococcales bacterium]